MKVGYRSHTHIAVSHAKYSYNECCILEMQATTESCQPFWNGGVS